MHPNQVQYILTYKDAFLGPLYFFLLLLLVFRWKRKLYKNKVEGRYIIPAFVLKMAGCVALACIYNFYYGYGDVHNYYTGEYEIWTASSYNIKYGLELIFKSLDNCSAKAQEFAFHMAFNEFSAATTYMHRITGFFGLFCFGTYLPTAMVFTTLSFIGSWRVFKIFMEEFPEQHKLVAIGCLFIPSSIVWAGNLLKDPLCIFGLGLCVTAMYSIVKKRFNYKNLLEILLGASILLILKDYLFFVFVASMLVTLYYTFIIKSGNVKLKIILRSLMFMLFISAIIWYYNNSDIVGDFIFEMFAKKTETIQNAISSINQEEGGSAYTIANANDYSPGGIITSYLLSVVVTLFRPFLWESNNVMALLNSLETTFVLLFTLFVMIRSFFFGFFTFATQKPILLFAFVFTFLLAPLVGFISFNFGTLIRYKLPLVPFYYTYILLLYAASGKGKLGKARQS